MLQENISEKLFTKLVGTLEDIVGVYRKLIEHLRLEKDVLIEANLEKLTLSNQQKEQLMMKLKSFDALRIKYVQELVHHFSLKSEQPRLLEIANHYEGEKAEKLRTLHSVLELLVHRSQELNGENQSYVEKALATLSGAVNEIGETVSGAQTLYERKGGAVKVSAEKSGHLVRREV